MRKIVLAVAASLALIATPAVATPANALPSFPAGWCHNCD